MQFDRCRKLFPNFEKLQTLKILICGIGGVGGYALDCLYKSGIQNITAIDFDIFEIHNQNRQIGSEYIGYKKTEIFKKLYPNIEVIDIKITSKWINDFDFTKFDYIIDAIDDIPIKIELIKKTYPKVISSMGAAKRTDPTKIEISTLKKTHTDPFARILRQKLKNYKDLKVVFSTEEPISCEMGSFIGVTGSFGMALCSEILKKS